MAVGRRPTSLAQEDGHAHPDIAIEDHPIAAPRRARIGGKGPPLVLIPGHPETWWAYARIMPALARDFTVIVPEIRGMGSPEVTAGGYDKTTQEDVFQLLRGLGHDKVNMAGHDIGAMVAFAFAANHPEATIKLALLDVPIPTTIGSPSRSCPRRAASARRSTRGIRLTRGGSPSTKSARSPRSRSPATACGGTSRTFTATCRTTTPTSSRWTWRCSATATRAGTASAPAMPGTAPGRRTSASAGPTRR